MKLNLYTIRDRLIDVYLLPFPAPDHNQAKMGVAAKVNSGDTDGICQAPHQFELHQIATLDTDTGSITATREYICDCSSLVRRSVRDNPPTLAAAGTGTEAIDRFYEAPHGTRGKTGTHPDLSQGEAPPSAQ